MLIYCQWTAWIFSGCVLEGIWAGKHKKEKRQGGWNSTEEFVFTDWQFFVFYRNKFLGLRQSLFSWGELVFTISESHWQIVMFFPECVMKIVLCAQHDCVKQIVQHLFLWYQIQNLTFNLIYVLHCILYSIVFMMVLLIISIFVSELQRRSFEQMWSLSIVQMHKNRKKLYIFHYSNTFTFFGV